MRIDAHAHGIYGLPPQPADLESYVAACRSRGIDRVALIGGEEEMFGMQKKCPDFVLPVIYLDIDTAQREDVRRVIDRGARAIKFIYPMRSFGHDAYFPLYEEINECKGTIVFHTGYVMVGLFDGAASAKAVPSYRKPSLVDIADMRPAAIDRIARGFPNLKILLAHFGNPWWEECWKMISSHPNVYADFSGGTAYRKSMSMWREMFAPDGQLDAAAAGKLCFASDFCYFLDNGFGFEPFISFYDRFFDAVGMPDELRLRINAGNSADLFGVASA
jgi:predicted TIM-barrel fold metal-dependent hydrolase